MRLFSVARVLFACLIGSATSCNCSLLGETPPTPSDLGLVVFKRAPWGTADTSAAFFSLRAGAGAFPANTKIHVQLPNGEMQTISANDQGGFAETQLSMSDAATIEFSIADEVGNPNPEMYSPSRVEWIAMVSSDAENPHSLSLVDDVRAGRDQGRAASAEELRLVSMLDADLLTIDARLAWHKRLPRPVPSIYYPAIAFDPIHQRTLIHDFESAPELSAWTLEGYEDLTVGGLDLRWGAVAFDTWRGQLMIIGNTVRDQHTVVMLYDGDEPEEVTGGPADLRGAALGYDNERGQIVVLTQPADANAARETWLWDGSIWLQTAAGGPSRESVAITFDENCRCLRLLEETPGEPNIWSWNGESWAQESSRGAAPQDRFRSGLVFDKKNRVLLSIGGVDIKEYKDGEWSHRGELPDELKYEHLSAVWDDRLNAVVMVLRHSVWTYDGEKFRVTVGEQRPPIANPSAAWSDEREEIVMLGEVIETGDFVAWAWNGFIWTELPLQGFRGPRASGIAFDSIEQRFVSFGGVEAHTDTRDTWILEDNVWSLHPTERLAPSRRVFAMMQEDRTRRAVLLFGGYGSVPLDDTWLFNRGGWRRVETSQAPAARTDAAMTWDSAQERVVLFGGQGNGTIFGDTWAWTGTEWIQLALEAPFESERFNASLVFDKDRQRVTLFGGHNIGDVSFDTHILQYPGWVLAPISTRTADRPTPSGQPALAYDASRRALVLVTDNNEGETWETEPFTTKQPGALYAFDWSAAGVESRQIERIDVRFEGRALSSVDAAPQVRTSTRVLFDVWNAREGRWLSTRLATPKAEDLLDGRTQKLHLMVRPEGIDRGDVLAALHVDAFELKVEYRVDGDVSYRGFAPRLENSDRVPSPPLVDVRDGVVINSGAVEQHLGADSCGILPIDSYRVSGFAHGDLIEPGILHNGDTVPSNPGTVVRAVFAGTVLTATSSPGWGGMVIVHHISPNGASFGAVYGGLEAPGLRSGDWLEMGDEVGKISSSAENGDAPHLAFAIQRTPSARVPSRYLQVEELQNWMNPILQLTQWSLCTCSPTFCELEARTAGAFCDGHQVVECRVDDDCFAESARIACEEGQRCSNGACVDGACARAPEFEWTLGSAIPPGLQHMSVWLGAGSAGDEILALNDAGTEIWSYSVCDEGRSTDLWEKVGNAPFPRFSGQRELVWTDSGGWYGLGGTNAGLETISHWDRLNDAWSPLLENNPHPVIDSAAVAGPGPDWVLDERIYVASPDGTFVSFDPAAASSPWEELTPFRGNGDRPPLAADRSRVYVEVSGFIYAFDPATPELGWTQLGLPIGGGLSDVSATMEEPFLLLVSGAFNDRSGLSDYVRMFNVEEREACPSVPMPLALRAPYTTVVQCSNADHRLVVMGGVTEEGLFNNNVWFARLLYSEN